MSDADFVSVMLAPDPVAPALAEGLGLIPLGDGSYRVKETETHWVDVVCQIYNWRVCRTPKASPMTYDRGWCYAGRGPQSFAAAVLAALAWDGADDTEPAGWIKNAFTGEHREPAQ